MHCYPANLAWYESHITSLSTDFDGLGRDRKQLFLHTVVHRSAHNKSKNKRQGVEAVHESCPQRPTRIEICNMYLLIEI